MGKLLIMAWRNVWRNWRRTVIAVIAIALGLTLILVFDGLLGGMDEALHGKQVRLQGGHVQVHAPGYREKMNRSPLLPLANPDALVQAAQAQPEAVAVAQRIRTSGMVSSREGTVPVAIIGIQPEQETPAVSMVAEKVAEGRYLRGDDEDVVLIGAALAKRLDVGVGDRVTLVGRATHEQMRRRTMTVVGLYDLDIKAIEEAQLYVSLLEAQTLYDLRDQATEIGVYLQGVGQEAEVVERLQPVLPGYEVDAWDTLDPTIKELMAIEDQVMGAFGLIILSIAGIGILNLMLMAVFERTREIGILGSMGLKRWETMVLFLLEGVLIGLLGAVSGCLLGGVIGAYLGRVGIDMMSLYGADLSDISAFMGLLGDRLYFRIGIDVFLQRALTVAIIAALASLYPAWQASKQEPAEALHYV
ncbi:MAG: ABC transporter permease [Anaerolineae bacterium]|jgi:ABC-type lipoprotein release transport system permease subunit